MNFSDLSIGQDELLYAKHLLFLASCNNPLKPPRHLTSSLTQNVSCTHVLLLSRNLLCMQGSHAYVRVKFAYFPC